MIVVERVLIILGVLVVVIRPLCGDLDIVYIDCVRTCLHIGQLTSFVGTGIKLSASRSKTNHCLKSTADFRKHENNAALEHACTRPNAPNYIVALIKMHQCFIANFVSTESRLQGYCVRCIRSFALRMLVHIESMVGKVITVFACLLLDSTLGLTGQNMKIGQVSSKLRTSIKWHV